MTFGASATAAARIAVDRRQSGGASGRARRGSICSPLSASSHEPQAGSGGTPATRRASVSQVLSSPELEPLPPPAARPRRRRSSAMRNLQELVAKYNITAADAHDLEELRDYELVVVADDSHSMTESLAAARISAWDRLRSTLTVLVDVGECFSKRGTDVYFINEPDPCLDVHEVLSAAGQFQRIMEEPPDGVLSLSEGVRRAVAGCYRRQQEKEHARQSVLLVVLTDGDHEREVRGSLKQELYAALHEIPAPPGPEGARGKAERRGSMRRRRSGTGSDLHLTRVDSTTARTDSLLTTDAGGHGHHSNGGGGGGPPPPPYEKITFKILFQVCSVTEKGRAWAADLQRSFPDRFFIADEFLPYAVGLKAEGRAAPYTHGDWVVKNLLQTCATGYASPGRAPKLLSASQRSSSGRGIDRRHSSKKSRGSSRQAPAGKHGALGGEEGESKKLLDNNSDIGNGNDDAGEGSPAEPPPAKAKEEKASQCECVLQ